MLIFRIFSAFLCLSLTFSVCVCGGVVHAHVRACMCTILGGIPLMSFTFVLDNVCHWLGANQ